MGSSSPPPLIEPADEEPFTDEQKASLADNLGRMYEQVHRRDLVGAVHDHRLLVAIHRGLFTDVRAHAGVYRDRARGSEHLTFGGHRSVHRNDVSAGLRRVDRFIERELVDQVLEGERAVRVDATTGAWPVIDGRWRRVIVVGRGQLSASCEDTHGI